MSGFLGGGVGPMALKRRVASSSLPNIAGLQLWLKADAITGLADGDAIATWTDSSGNGRNATQATAEAQPVYKTGIVNGKPVVRFNGGDALLLGDILDSIFSGATKHHVFCVTKPTSIATGTILAKLGDATHGENNRQFILRLLANGKYSHYAAYAADGTNLTVVNSSSNYSTSAFAVLSASYDGTVGSGSANSTARVQMTVNGAAQTETVEASVGNFGNIQNTAAQLSIGAAVGAVGTIISYALVGDIAEIIIYDSVLSDANRQAVEAYLSAKYGIALA